VLGRFTVNSQLANVGFLPADRRGEWPSRVRERLGGVPACRRAWAGRPAADRL